MLRHLKRWKPKRICESMVRCLLKFDFSLFNLLSDSALKTVSSTEDLKIVGITHNNYYSPGDLVNLTCVSGPTKPPTILSWFINRKQVTKHFGLPVNISKQLIDLTPNGLTSTSLSITFQISGRFFQAKTGTIELACESILTTGKPDPIQWRKHEQDCLLSLCLFNWMSA